jgi:CHAT domain-containing protein
VIIANPEFGGDLRGCYERGFEHKKDAAQAKEASVFPQGVFCPLPGTAGEAEALKKILPNAHVVTEGRVTKSAIKQVRGPMILHVATHGFFLEDVFVRSAQTSGRGMFIGRKSERDYGAQSKRVDPLLRSGLALSGANLRRGADDGILTALEVAGLDLWGTKLVVLSACETGVGEVHNWDGVHGLRRALVLAGSEAQMMSLWKVDDDGTRDLMIDYYKGLQAGQGRSEALRSVQLRMLRNEDGKGRVHPYFWASFIQSGEWSNLGRKP